MTDEGKKQGSSLPELEKGKTPAIFPSCVTPAFLAKPDRILTPFTATVKKPGFTFSPHLCNCYVRLLAGKEMGSCLPLLEEEGQDKEKPLGRPAAENLVNPGKKIRRTVPMTDEERKRITDLKEQHRSGLQDYQVLFQLHKDLCHQYDELLFRRRCLAARLVSRIVFQRRDAAYVKLHFDMDLKVGDKLPEELKKARPPITKALLMWHEMGRAMDVGLDNFIDEDSDPEVYRRRILALVPRAVHDESGAPLDSVASQE